MIGIYIVKLSYHTTHIELTFIVFHVWDRNVGMYADIQLQVDSE